MRVDVYLERWVSRQSWQDILEEHIQVSLCKAKIDATMRGHLLRGMKLRGHVRISNRLGPHVRHEPISVSDEWVILPF